jgi:transposase
MVHAVVDSGLSNAEAARRFNTTPKTVGKWLKRFRAEGIDGLRDRSSKPLSSPGQTAPATCAVVEALRRQRYTGQQIAAELGISPATVSRILRRLGLNRLSSLEPAEPVRRYERGTLAICSTSTSKSSLNSRVLGIASREIVKAKATVAASAGSSSMLRLMMPPASPSFRSCLTTPSKAPSLS